MQEYIHILMRVSGYSRADVLAAIHFAFEMHRSASWGVSQSLHMHNNLQQSVALGQAVAPAQDSVPNDLLYRASSSHMGSCRSENGNIRGMVGINLDVLARIPPPVSIRVPVLFDRYLSNSAASATVTANADDGDITMTGQGGVNNSILAPFAMDPSTFIKLLRETGLM
jgi:hypothetical protein